MWRLCLGGVIAVAACWRQADAAPCAPLAAGSHATCSVDVGGRTREYRIVVPASVKAPAPLVVNLHGRKGTAEEQESELLVEAEREGFVLLSPQAYERSWNAGVGFGAAHDEGVDDVAFVRAVIADASRLTSVDARRVYAAGLSNGGGMVHRLACEASDVIAAIASVAGPIADRNTETGVRAFTCAPARPVPVMMIHGKRDLCTPYDGGQGLDAHGNVATPAAAAEWVTRDACTTTSTVQLGSTTCEVHGGCGGGAEVVLCTMTSGGHVWPGGPKYPLWRGCGGEWPDDFRASDQMWTFFAAHPMPAPGAAAVAWQPAPLAVVEMQLTSEGLELAPVETVDLPFDRSILTFGLRGAAPGELGSAGTYQASSLSVAGALSLYSRLRVAGPKLSALRVMVQFRAEGERVQADMFSDDQRVVKGALGLAAVYVSPTLNVYGLYAGVGIAGTRDRLSSPTLLPSVLGIGAYRSSKQLTWIYGGGLGYAFGKPWLLPAAGLAWNVAPTWAVTTILPIFVNVKHELSRRLSADLMLSVSGDRFDFSNEGAFPGAPDKLQLRMGEGRLGVGVAYRWRQRWSWHGEVGVLGPRTLKIVDDTSSSIMTSEAKGVGYLSTTVTYAFGNAPH